MTKRLVLRGLMLALMLLLLCAAVSASPSEWAQSEVDQAISDGLVPEHLQDNYQSAITRKEFCELIAQLIPDVEGRQFPDCDSPEVSRCAALEILTGFPDGNFYPDLSLTREQAATILFRTATVLGLDASQSYVLPFFSDLGSAAGFGMKAISWAARNQVMLGVSGGRFDPKGTYTREQSILTILRLLAIPTPQPQRTILANEYEIAVFEEPRGITQTRRYQFSNGTEALACRALDSVEKTTLCSIYVPGNATIRIPDGKNWSIGSLKTGRYSASCCYVNSTSGPSYWIYLPQQYALRENNSLEYLPGKDGWLEVQTTNSGHILNLVIPGAGAGTAADYTVIASDALLFDWTAEAHKAENFMVSYTLNDAGRWCYDGYYYEAPSTYYPTGKNYFYRNVGCYFGKSMSYGSGVYYGCDVFSQVIADTMLQQQSEPGYFPSCSRSNWLWGDYGIDAGYYDTRFNSDLMEILYRIYVNLGGDQILPAVNRYFDFYVFHAFSHHRETVSGGWLIDDYSIPNTETQTHTSLNHQLAEISVLYKWGDLLERTELTDLADTMLLAIFDTTDNWIRPDHNLHYSISAAGIYGDQDYPSLTYNDLFLMQDLIQRRGYPRSEALDRLMDAKMVWMQRNGVTDYRKTVY